MFTNVERKLNKSIQYVYIATLIYSNITVERAFKVYSKTIVTYCIDSILTIECRC